MTTRYVTPSGAGTQDGTSWANAAPFATLQAVHDALLTGDTIYLQAGVEYNSAGLATLNWSMGNIVSGQKVSGGPGLAMIVGDRTKAWPANGTWTDGGAYLAASPGTNWMNYKDNAAAAGGCTFSYLAFRHIGTAFRPLFNTSATTGQITLDHCRLWNGFGLVYVVVSSDGQCGITATNCRATGYSGGMFRAFYDMSLTDCYGDARNQFHTPSTNLFGAHVQDAIVGVTTRQYNAQFIRCSFRNHAAGAPAGSSQDPATTGHYPQGDGIVLEENTNLLPSSDLYLYGSADRGIDIKCAVPEGYLTRVYVEHCSYGIGVHDDTVVTTVIDSYLGTSWMPSYRTDISALIQGSGQPLLKRCYLSQDVPAGRTTANQFVAQVTGQASHVQSGVTIPNRVGKFLVQDSIRHQGSGSGLANIASIGFGTPTYTEVNVLPA